LPVCIYSPCFLVSRCVFVNCCYLVCSLFFFRCSSSAVPRVASVPSDERFLLAHVITRASDLCLYYDYSPAFSLFGLFATLGLPTCVPNPASKTFNPFNLPLCCVAH